MKENWKDIKGYEGEYQISDLGNVKSRKMNFGNRPKEIILKPVITVWGYQRIGLRKNNKPKNFFVHRLVAENFVPNLKNKKYVNHIDGNKLNNKAINLEWVTAKENSNASKKVKEMHRWNEMPVKDNKGNTFKSYREAGRFWGISPNTVKRDCLNLTQYSDTQKNTKFERTLRFTFLDK